MRGARWLLGALAVFGCEQATDFDDRERRALEALANPPPPPANPSNTFADDDAAARLGQQLYFDPEFSGNASNVDVLERAVPNGRAATGAPVRISCASCHDLHGGGVDRSSIPSHLSIGAGWLPVNALSVINAAYYDMVFWNGRSDSLWGMIIPVVESKQSMNFNRAAVAWRMFSVYRAQYEAIFRKALPFVESREEAALHAPLPGSTTGAAAILCAELPDAPEHCPSAGCRAFGDLCLQRYPLNAKPAPKFAQHSGCQPGNEEPFGDAWDCMGDKEQKEINEVASNFAKAIEAYERRLLSVDALFDKHMRGADRMSPSAVRGARLFVGKASCVECHSGPMFTDQKFHNIGVPLRGVGVITEPDCPRGNRFCDCVVETSSTCQPWGVFAGLSVLQGAAWKPFRRDATGDQSREAYYTMPRTSELRGAWRTPSLRNVALTAPYMHDGAYATLEEVVEHYDAGAPGGGGAPEEKSALIQPLHLRADEKADLIAFLRALSGDPIPAEWAERP